MTITTDTLDYYEATGMMRIGESAKPEGMRRMKRERNEELKPTLWRILYTATNWG